MFRGIYLSFSLFPLASLLFSAICKASLENHFCHLAFVSLGDGLDWGFPGGSAGNESACSAGDLGLIPGLGRSPGQGNSYPLQYSGLENSMDCIVPGVEKSRT